MPGGWFFSGACATGSVGATGGTLAMRDAAGLATTVTFGASDANRAQPFIVGEAAESNQIGGTLNGRLAFPAYGGVPCVDAKRAPARCAGLPLLYLLIINAGNVAIAFPATPRIGLEGTNRFRGVRRCALDTLIWNGKSASAVQWLVRPLVTAPSSPSELLFAPAARSQHYAGGGAFTVFGVVCQ